ncbi:hypothetical protein J3R82DRAFT_6496 [Butyriboletus roseoflavus]|nr:hypothetical protein J3R82DRAFT_6496 [Butyriboletus roseoflavus]
MHWKVYHAKFDNSRSMHSNIPPLSIKASSGRLFKALAVSATAYPRVPPVQHPHPPCPRIKGKCSSHIYYESGSGPSVPQYEGQSWLPTATTGDQNRYSQPHQSVDSVGILLEAHDAEDMNYSSNLPFFNCSLPSTPLHDPGITIDATYTNDNIPSHPFANLPFPHHLEIDHRQTQHQRGYDPHESVYDYTNEHFVHNAHQPSGGDLAYTFTTQNIHTFQTTQGLSPPVYPYMPSTQLVSVGHGRPVQQNNTRAARPTLSLRLDRVDTATVVLPNADTRQYSHLSSVPVATPPSQSFAPGPSRPLPSSPERKRLLPLSADDEHSTARRVVPRHDRAWSVHSTSSDSHRRNRSYPDIYGRGPLIPQERYSTSSISSYNTPEQHPPVNFSLENPNQIGIPIADVLNRTDSFHRILDRTQPVIPMGKKTFTLRVQWPGYKSWSKTIAALDWTRSRAPLTRAKLAEAVATGVRDLIEKYRNEQYDPDYAEWNVGPNGIQLDQICLVRLYHVSKGSWQPELCLLEPRH